MNGLRLLILLSLLLCSDLVFAEVYDVYLLAGQSNMDGRGDASKLTEQQRQAAADAIIYYRNPLRSTDGWKPLATGFSVPPGFKGALPSPKFGPEIGFAAAMKEWNPNHKIALIKGSRGGTSLRSDWMPGEAGQPETQGPLYRKFIETIQLATADLERQGHTYVIRGLLWHQGESDSKASEQTYRERLTTFIDRIREDVDVPDLPVVVGEVFDNGKRDGVREAQRRVGTSSPHVSFASVRGLTTWDEGTHFDAHSQWLLGRRFAAALSKRPMTVVCLGNSITKSGYPALLSDHVDVQAINAGVGGNTSTQGLRRMEKDVFAHDPEVVVLMFGTNDLRVDNQRVHVPVAQFKKNIEAMVDRCEKYGAKVVLCTLLPIDAQPFYTRHQRPPFEDAGGLDALVQQYRTATQEVAANREVVLLDLHAQLAKHPQAISSDGVHPSEAGKQLIAELVAGAIKSLSAENASSELNPTTADASATKPNVLFISVDDLNDWQGGLGGNSQAKTPNLDKLFRESVLFTNAHCSQAVCTASRNSLLSGIHPSRSGWYTSTASMRKTYDQVMGDHKMLPEYFRTHGYKTLAAGKVFHQGVSDYKTRTDDFWDVTAPSYKVPKHLLARGEGYGGTKFYPFPKNGSQIVDRYGPDFADGHSLCYGALDREDIPGGIMFDELIADWASEQLDRDHDKPFFMAVGFVRPHVPYTAPSEFFDLYDLDKINVPDVPADEMSDIPLMGKSIAYGTIKTGDHYAVVNLSDSYWKEMVYGYLACVSFADAQVGKVLDALANSKHADNTIVVLWSDHGQHLGEKKHWRKQTLWEEATRVPLCFRLPGQTNGTQCQQAVSLLDVYPTLLELCDLPPADKLGGTSLVPQIRDPARQRQQPVLTTWYYRNHSIRSNDWRYIRYRDGSEELYDHRNDPGEHTNLAGRPEFASVIAEHQKWLPKTDALPAGKDRWKGDKLDARIETWTENDSLPDWLR
ncbi:sulfatase-like hydrolase/transferase [Roseimaritima ulvae]|uniref:Choline-sulfatase n=1 Tax=Roseimaritima ulvae TaxID=980254 RepID=A0A5B9R8V8_9BACT|nr:sulfatase-like hydrolase/transferase [Roseimaritima ulvae]QEG43321.1 Choline-sulfatase [Roseimaritima ulvae]